MENFEGQRERRTKYDDFRIGSEAEKYRLASVGGYVGTAGRCSSKYGVDYINYSLDNQNNILCHRRFDFTSEVFIRTDFR